MTGSVSGNVLRAAAAAAAIICLVPAESRACGPYFQPSYSEKSPYPTVFRRKAAVRRLVAALGDLIPKVPEIPDGLPWKEALEKDLAAAVELRLPKLSPAAKEKLIRNYADHVSSRRKKPGEVMKDLPELPEALAEFRLYRAGVAEMTPGGKVIPPSWQKLLALPPRDRRFRTVWVYFMLGNYLRHDCSRYYARCRAAARAGFADTHGLVRASYRNEFFFARDPVRKIRVALEAQRNRPDMELLAEDFPCIAPRDDAECVRMMADPLCREVLAIFGCDRESFFREGSKYKFRNADIPAYRAYQAGDVKKAEAFLKLRVCDTLLSTYVEAKIARHRGDTALAAKKLRQWLKFVEKIDPCDRADIIEVKHGDDPYDMLPSHPLKEDVYGLLGNVLVLRRDFAEAAACFYRAGQVESDFSYVAERLMTLNELAGFAETVAGDAASENQRLREAAQTVRHMTARRAFREGRFDLARKYLPGQYRGALEQYLGFLRSADRFAPGDERALCLYNAAKIMRLQGMELCGTEGPPDQFRYFGNYWILADFENCTACRYDLREDVWTVLCPEHKRLYEDLTVKLPGTRYLPAPRNQRFHYRYRAAELAKRAGDCARDEDLRALINLFAGECLRIRAPRKADLFYKRLVKNSPHNAVAKIADRLRWFPECPALKGEINSLKPCASVAVAKDVMRKAAAELAPPAAGAKKR